MPEVKRVKCPPNARGLIEALRDTGYDFNTALADIIDNSIDAKANKIEVTIKMDLTGNIFISVLDDGCGMDYETLVEGMTYGSSRKKEPNRLGKFGLGLKTASTAFCKRLSVVTREAPGKECKATWDLDEVNRASDWDLLTSSPSKEETNHIDKIAPNSSGTLVTWGKNDRVLKDYQEPGGSHAQKALKKTIENFRHHVSMVFQRFLDTDDSRARNIEIFLNGKPAIPWSPFCEEYSDLVAEDKRPVEFESGKKSEFLIEAYILPRKEEFPTEEAAKKANVSNELQGIYIYRENRLIQAHTWLGMWTKEPHGSLLRVNFSFDHSLDEAFRVDVKKSRIVVQDEIYDHLKGTILPAPRNAANQRYRSGQKKSVQATSTSAHAASNRNISEHEESVLISEVQVTNAETGEVKITNEKGTVETRLKILSLAPNSNEIHIKPAPSLDDGLLWEPAIIEKHHAVIINTGHDYYSKVYIPNRKSGVTMQGLDSLLWALTESELGCLDEATKNHFKDLRYQTSRLLRRLVENLPEPADEECMNND